MIAVCGLYVYPVKSCAGVALQHAAVVPRGLAHDRRWMVVDGRGQFVTQRAQPRMALVQVSMMADALRLHAPEMPPLHLPLDGPSGPRRTVTVWGDHCEAVEDRAAGQWFARFLGIECTAVYMPDDAQRPVEPEHARDGDIVSFADAYPFLLTSEESLRDLNGRLTDPVSMVRFRPNIVVRGTEPFAEDDWERLRIGEVAFRVAKRCARCTIPTVDPQTGRRGKEPLRTLARYRQRGSDVLFGVNLVHDGPGELRVGDAVSPV